MAAPRSGAAIPGCRVAHHAAMRSSLSTRPGAALALLLPLLLLLSLLPSASAIKFDLTSTSAGPVKCIWNYALSDTLVVVTVNTKAHNSVEPAGEQRIDVEVVDGSKHNNIYLSKKGIGKAETRMAINTHSHADLGVCFRNVLRKGESCARVARCVQAMGGSTRRGDRSRSLDASAKEMRPASAQASRREIRWVAGKGTSAAEGSACAALLAGRSLVVGCTQTVRFVSWPPLQSQKTRCS